jgi:hypothetical protein
MRSPTFSATIEAAEKRGLETEDAVDEATGNENPAPVANAAPVDEKPAPNGNPPAAADTGAAKEAVEGAPNSGKAESAGAEGAAIGVLPKAPDSEGKLEGAVEDDETEATANLQSEHCGPLFGPQNPSDPGITFLPRFLPQYSKPVWLERVMTAPEILNNWPEPTAEEDAPNNPAGSD